MSLTSNNRNKIDNSKWDFSNLQIGDNDLVGNKFNGHDLHLYLRENKIDSTHLVSVKSSSDKNTFYVSYNDSYYKLKSELQEVEQYYNTQAMLYPFAFDIMKKELFLNTDIVHYHLINNYFFNLNLLPIMTRMKPSVWTIHDPWVLTGHCIHPYECTRWKTHCGDCPHLDTHFPLTEDTTALNFELKKNIIQSSKLSFIVASNFMKQYVEKSPITKGMPVYVVPFGINQELFKPKDSVEAKKALKVDPDSFVIMFRADKNAFKGLDIITEALKNIKIKKKITILTVGEKGLLKEIEKDYKSKFDLKEYGWLKDDKNLVKLYQACDLFLMPSRQEAFGMMAIEAMSCRKTVLSTKGTALVDTINAPTCGIATEHNPKAYTKALQRLLDNPDILEKHNIKSLKYAQKNHSHEVYLEKIISVYKEVMSKHKLDEDAQIILDQLKKHSLITKDELIELEEKTSKITKKEDYKAVFEYLDIDYILYKLEKKFKGKKVVLYGTGILFEALCEYCDLSGLDIVAITDRKIEEESKIFNFKAIPPKDIKKESPDVILITVLHPYFINKYLTEDLYVDDKLPEIETVIDVKKIGGVS